MLLSYCRSTSSSKGQEASCLYLHFFIHFFFVICYTVMLVCPSSLCFMLWLVFLLACVSALFPLCTVQMHGVMHLGVCSLSTVVNASCVL